VVATEAAAVATAALIVRVVAVNAAPVRAVGKTAATAVATVAVIPSVLAARGVAAAAAGTTDRSKRSADRGPC